MRYLPPATALRNDCGTTAVEFAIIAPVFIALSVGVIFLCFGLYVVGSLQYAVEEAARCASVKKTVCSDSGTTATYARSHYYGTGPTPSFTYSASGCGNTVTATLNYVIDLGLSKVTVPLTASGCFP
jgi:Flp pilus assembly protein TadG